MPKANFKKGQKMLILKGFVDKTDDKNDGLLDVSVASTGLVDREGEIISQDGWDLKNFKKNPQLLWSHNIRESRPPIGKVTKIWFEGEGKNKVMKFKAMFDMADEFAKEIYRKIKEGFLNAFSVGFMPLEREGSTYTKAELLEISVVPVPSNPQALIEMRAKGMQTMTWKEVAESEPIEESGEPIGEEVSTQPDEVTEEEIGDEDKVKPADVEPSEIEEELNTPQEGEEEAKDDLKALVRVMLKEVREEKKARELDDLRDALRIVYQSVAVALKKLKNMK